MAAKLFCFAVVIFSLCHLRAWAFFHQALCTLPSRRQTSESKAGRYSITMTRTSTLNLLGGLFGRGGGDGKGGKDSVSGSENLGGVAGVMDSMGSLKDAQRVGKLTQSLVRELALTTVEGVAQEGKVKVIFDCQQRPVSVNIDEGWFKEADLSDLSAALTTAMQDGHGKSIEKMDEKMKSLYAELGLPSS